MSGAGTSALLARVLAARDTWCELRPASDGKPALRIKIRRPPEGDFHRFARVEGKRRSQQAHELVSEFTVGWEGMSEAELFGAAVGSEDPIPFDEQAWPEIVKDRQDWLEAAWTHLTNLVGDYIDKKAAAAKN